MVQRTISRIAHLPKQQRAPGFAVAFLHPQVLDEDFGPFLQIDAFSLATPVFKPHPHAGFSAVTYILPESQTGFINRDTLGNRQRIGPGALHWTLAGRGLHHEEVPERVNEPALGLQMFIDLPLALKEADPAALHLEPEEIPRLVQGGAEVRLVVGTFGGLSSPLVSPTPGVTLLDIALDAAAELTIPLSPEDAALLYVRSGAITVEAQAVGIDDLASTTRSGSGVTIRGGPGGARLVVFGGPPLNQPVVAQGPFVLSSEAQMQRAIERYQRGEMGRLQANSYSPAGEPIL